MSKSITQNVQISNTKCSKFAAKVQKKSDICKDSTPKNTQRVDFPPRDHPDNRKFHPKTTLKVTDKVAERVTERRHLKMQFCNDAIDERAIRLPYNGRKRNARLTTRALDKEENRMKSGVRDKRLLRLPIYSAETCGEFVPVRFVVSDALARQKRRSMIKLLHNKCNGRASSSQINNFASF